MTACHTGSHRGAVPADRNYVSAIRRNPALHVRLAGLVEDWLTAWSAGEPPVLSVLELGPRRHLVLDTRAGAAEPARIVGPDEARTLLRGATERTVEVEAALDRRQMVEVDGRDAAIACAPPSSAAWPEVVAAA